MWRCNREISDNICNDLKVCMIFQRSGPILHQSATFCQDILSNTSCDVLSWGSWRNVNGLWWHHHAMLPPPPPSPCLRVIAVVYSHFRGFHEARACWLLAWVATLCANRISWENNNYPTIATGLMAHTFTHCYYCLRSRPISLNVVCACVRACVTLVLKDVITLTY